MDHLIFSPKLDESNPLKKFAVLIALKKNNPNMEKKLEYFIMKNLLLKCFKNTCLIT